MASESERQDQILAQRLQTQELQQRRQSLDEQSRNDEDAARQLAQNSGARMLEVGESSVVRLHHPLTRRQIGETVIAHLASENSMRFELQNNRGKYLRVNRNGSIDFAPVTDDSTVFLFEMTSTGTMYLMCKAFRKKGLFDTMMQSRPWYLTMSLEGVLSGNGAKSQQSQWVMVSVDSNGSMLSSPPPARPPAMVPAGLPQPAPLNAPQANTEHTTENMMLREAAATGNSGSTQTAPAPAPPRIDPYNGFPGFDAGKEALMNFFATDSGQEFLQLPQYSAAYRLYLDNMNLAKILHRPDWPVLAETFTCFLTKQFVFDVGQVHSVADFETIKSFYEMGYTVVRQAVRPELVDDANRVLAYWLAKHHNNHVSETASAKDGIFWRHGHIAEYTGTINSDPSILALYYDSPVYHLIEHMLGTGDVALPHRATSVLTAFPTLSCPRDVPLMGNMWFIDGFTTTGGHSPYSLVIGVALSDIDEGDTGNHCVYPGSHMILQEMYKDQAQCRGTMLSDDPGKVSKPNLGQSVALLLKKGDIFICSQRTAYLRCNNNLGKHPTTIAYFKISHVDHQVLKDLTLDDLWVEYKSAPYYLESANEAEAKQKLLMPSRNYSGPEMSASSTLTPATNMMSAPPAYTPEAFNTKQPSDAIQPPEPPANLPNATQEVDKPLIDFDFEEQTPNKSDQDSTAKNFAFSAKTEGATSAGIEDFSDLWQILPDANEDSKNKVPGPDESAVNESTVDSVCLPEPPSHPVEPPQQEEEITVTAVAVNADDGSSTPIVTATKL